MELHIRPFQAGDIDSIRRLNAEELGYDFPLEKTAEKLAALAKSPSDRIFVAEAGGVAVGYVHAAGYDVIYAPHMKNIMGIAVSGRCRRQGIGRALLSAVEAWARESGACGVRLVSGAERTGAHEFYRACGYGGGKQQINFKKYF